MYLYIYIYIESAMFYKQWYTSYLLQSLFCSSCSRAEHCSL